MTKRGALLLLLALAGCARHSVGPRTIRPAQFGYNEAISRSWDEQLLLNLVRLRYRDNPLFVDVNSITASYSFNRSALLSALTDGDLDLGELGAELGLAMEENPVITYGYLRGEEFAQRMLSPLSAADLQALALSGWSVERLMLCCYQSVNEVENALTATGPTPELAPDFERFHRVAALVRRLQQSRRLALEFEADGKSFLRFRDTAGPEAAELRSLLALDPQATRFEVVPPRGERTPAQVRAQGRSLLGVMFFLAHAVEVPEVHRRAGKVTITRDSTGAEFDWNRVLGPLLRIRSAASRPADAAVRVAYRGHWYWIADDDLNSKSTFALLRLLLFLKSTGAQGPSPLITVQTH